jgi:chromosome segregation ATPase
MWFHRIVTDSSESLPTDLATAHAMILAERVEAEALAANARAAAARAKAEVAHARADLSSTEALIGRLKLEIEKLRRQLYGTRSERTARLLEQIELQLEELEATATEDELAAEQVVARSQAVQSFQRKRPSDRGTERAAVTATLIMTAKLNDVDPQAWLRACAHQRPRRPQAGRASALELAKAHARSCQSGVSQEDT